MKTTLPSLFSPPLLPARMTSTKKLSDSQEELRVHVDHVFFSPPPLPLFLSFRTLLPV
ncbi:hypothetical protein LMJF_35_0650 [Leishmania major strain Friedlin]|uniref:Uncharacterized protein n=1 Tax=Leishmania major TaxID=5664 RepID=E9AEP0_LEIMA|nr:hypothetical protein LMJF_35_0650 [Leishmania major strain Friedlin]CAG9582416.1 beta-fructofuranosidase_-_putative [Leishmania major strain Friedlin]CBZ12693.1 hypothetical protein LMJF_35_0650 [Leishmania major strain Friedlin]|eukprot:XP_003722460.1 hypothetical protein LMJF_35_0650 [Leishmania major strain Friedlin]